MRVWMDISKNLPMKPLNVIKPNDVVEFEIDTATGELMSDDCRGTHTSMVLPFIRGREPMTYSSCVTEELPFYFESFDNNDFGNGNTDS